MYIIYAKFPQLSGWKPLKGYDPYGAMSDADIYKSKTKAETQLKSLKTKVIGGVVLGIRELTSNQQRIIKECKARRRKKLM